MSSSHAGYVSYANVQRSFDSNSSSPLLSLPPEIRNRIYVYVLGGNDLHVNIGNHGYCGGGVKMKLKITICTAVVDEESAATMIRDGEEDTEIADWHDRHHFCKVSSSQVPYCVSLLRTCSQVHSEAALVPFQKNRFIFEIAEALQSFLRRIMYIQRRENSVYQSRNRKLP